MFCRGPEEVELPSVALLSSGLWSLEAHLRKVEPPPPAASYHAEGNPKESKKKLQQCSEESYIYIN